MNSPLVRVPPEPTRFGRPAAWFCLRVASFCHWWRDTSSLPREAKYKHLANPIDKLGKYMPSASQRSFSGKVLSWTDGEPQPGQPGEQRDAARASLTNAATRPCPERSPNRDWRDWLKSGPPFNATRGATKQQQRKTVPDSSAVHLRSRCLCALCASWRPSKVGKQSDRQG